MLSGAYYLLDAYYLLGAHFLPGTWHHLLSVCALIEYTMVVRDEWKSWHQEHIVHLMVILNSKKSYTGVSCFWLTQSHKLHPLWLTTGLLGLVNLLLHNVQSPAYLLDYTMAVSHGMVSSRRMKSSDFTSILARRTHLKIYCTLMPSAADRGGQLGQFAPGPQHEGAPQTVLNSFK